MTSSNKRYNLVLPSDLFEQVKQAADQRGKTTVELIRQALTLLLLVIEFDKDPEKALIIREGDKEREIFIL